jgi:hypothetical protein
MKAQKSIHSFTFAPRYCPECMLLTCLARPSLCAVDPPRHAVVSPLM